MGLCSPQAQGGERTAIRKNPLRFSAYARLDATLTPVNQKGPTRGRATEFAPADGLEPPTRWLTDTKK
jgi:hypothetical protein